MFKKHNATITEILAKKPVGTDWQKVLGRHQLMMARIQQERLIHLIVMGLVGIVMTVFIFMTVTTQEMFFLAVVTPLLLLFVGYIFHYRFLENMTQNWYIVEDEILENL